MTVEESFRMTASQRVHAVEVTDLNSLVPKKQLPRDPAYVQPLVSLPDLEPRSVGLPAAGETLVLIAASDIRVQGFEERDGVHVEAPMPKQLCHMFCGSELHQSQHWVLLQREHHLMVRA